MLSQAISWSAVSTRQTHCSIGMIDLWNPTHRQGIRGHTSLMHPAFKVLGFKNEFTSGR